MPHNNGKPKQQYAEKKRQQATKQLTLLSKGNEAAQVASTSSQTDYVAFGAGALTASAVVALGLYFVRRSKQTADEEDEGFHRV